MFKLAIALAAVLTLALGTPISTSYAAEAGDTPADVATPPIDIDTDDEAAAEDQEEPSGDESEAEEETQPE